MSLPQEEMSIVARRIAATEGSFPIVVIQGDILPVVKYFQFAGRLRRLDMTNPLEQIRVTVSLYIPHALFLYQSRVSNIVADNLAGQASNLEMLSPLPRGVQPTRRPGLHPPNLPYPSPPSRRV